MSAPLRLAAFDVTPDRASDAVDRELVRRLHECGPRPTGELLEEIARLDPDLANFIADRLCAYTAVGPSVYRMVGADDWAT